MTTTRFAKHPVGYRLTAADYANGHYYHYTYDAVGNRPTQTSMVNSLPSTVEYVYDDANRLTSLNGVSYTWDNNGNLLNDGVNTYTYNTANQLKTMTGASVAASYSYNGLGDRLQEIANGQTTTFAMDLNTGLTQALSDGTNTYIYGNGRIAQTQDSATEYFLGDALGSVRQVTNTSGAVTYARAYDPYGVVTSISGSSQSAYGYTNEYMSQGLIYLRSRWYDPLTGRFNTRDSWQGDYNRPLSLNRWNYVEGNPVNYTDPSGRWIHPECQWMPTKGLYEYCILLKYGLQPMNFFDMGRTVTGERGCYSGPTEYRAPGYLEGADFVYGGWPMGLEGREVVYDFATMERSKFAFRGGQVGSFVSFVGGSIYWGSVSGFPFNDIAEDTTDVVEAYQGLFLTFSKGLSIGEGGNVGAGRSYFYSPADLAINGKSTYVGAGFGASIVLDLSAAVTNYYPEGSITSYATNGQVRRQELVNDILRGAGSPFSYWKEVLASHGISITRPLPNEYISVQRWHAVLLAHRYADAYEAMWKINHP